MKKVLILLLLVLFSSSCRKYRDESYFYYYQVETTSTNITATYRTIYGDIVTTDNIFSGWIYGWGCLKKKSKYYIMVKNNTDQGWIKVRIIRDKDTLITKTHTTQVVIQ